MLRYFVSDLTGLRSAASNRCRHAFHPGKRANRDSQVTLYIAFTINFQLRDFPAGVGTLLSYGEFLARGYKAGKSVTSALSSLKTFHVLHGFGVESFESFKLQLFRRALPLTCRQEPHRAPPLPFAVLEDMCGVLEGGGTRAILFAALLTMARLSFMTPSDGQPFDVSRFPNLGDLRFQGDRVLFRIKWGMAHQAVEQAYWVPVLLVRGSRACPVRYLQQIGRPTNGRHLSSPLFGEETEAKFFFTLRSAREWLRVTLAAVGSGGAGYTFHSLRRGACSRAFELGADLRDIQNLGGWRSTAVQRYIPALASRTRAATRLS